jgi:hypothetical protein
MKISKKGSSMKQIAYARRIFGGQGKCKKQVALEVGYSPNVANSISSHIENQPGFHNAMAVLARDSNNIALEVMSQFKARGFDDFSNKDLVGALNAIASAWSRFNTPAEDPNRGDNPGNNKLRTVILNQIENQTIVEASKVTDVTPQQTNDTDF